MDESFPAKRLKSNKMINHATSGSSLHSFHGFTDATCQSNRALIRRISWERKGNVLFNDALNTFYLWSYGRKEGNVLFNDTLILFMVIWHQTYG